MANVEGKFYRGETQRRGVTPVSPPNAVDDPQDPLNPPGAGNTTTYKQLGDTIDKSFVGKNGYVPVVTDENALTLQPNIPNTGVAVFGGVVFNSTTTVDIGIVRGYIVDNETDPLVSSVQYIEYAGATGVTVTTVGSGTRTYALLKSDGTIHFQNTYPTSEDRKQMIYLFKVGHPAGAITVVANEPDFVLSPLQQFRDLFQAFNYVNEGVYPYADAADLTFNTSAGLIVGNGINFVPEPANPNILTVAATTPCTFVYRSQTGAGGGATTLIDPNIWDNAGTIDTVGGGSNRSTIQYIHYSPNLGFVIQPGQAIYDTLVEAIAEIGKEEHVVYENLIRDAILIGVLALTRSTTDLTDTNDARFFRADIFGQLVGSAAGTSVTTLQRAYLNSLIPQIETVSGELAIKNGGASDTDVVFAIRSLLDVDNIQMYGDGRIRHADAVNADESATLGQVIDLALGDGLISGGIVQWTGTGYNFDVSTAFARFKGVYTLISLPDTLTLTTPDATNDRIDLFILQILFDVDGIPTGMEADFITGTPAANPVKPQINPETQIELTQVLVDAGSTTPTLTEEVIYDQNTEWTGTSSGTGTAVFNSAVDPYQGSISVETTNIQNGFYIQFNNGSEIDISTYQTIGFHIKLKASLGANQNLYVTFLNGSLAPVSNFVLINLNKSLTGYQFIGIALNSVNFTSFDVQYIRFSFVRTSGPTTFSGYFLDIVKLEGGIAPPVTQNTFLNLTDTPSTYSGQGNKVVSVKADETGLEFTTASGGASTFLALTDTPSTYSAQANKFPRVNGGETALVFDTVSPFDLDQEGASDGDVLTWVAANSRYEPVTPSGGRDNDAVHFDAPDGKTATEKRQARTNIGISESEPTINATAGVLNSPARTTNNLVFTAATSIVGLPAGIDGETCRLQNRNTVNILLVNDSSPIGVSDRFDFGVGFVLEPKKYIDLVYNGTSSRWNRVTNFISPFNIDANPQTISGFSGNSAGGVFTLNNTNSATDSPTFRIQKVGVDTITITNNQYTSSIIHTITASSSAGGTFSPLRAINTNTGAVSSVAEFFTSTTERTYWFRNRSFIVGAPPTPIANGFHLKAHVNNTLEIFRVDNSDNNPAFQIIGNRQILMPALPTSSAGLAAGSLWNNGGVLNIV